MSKKRKSRKSHMGSGIDDFLKEEGIFEEAQAQAVKEVVAWQLDEAMRKKKISKNKMATLLKTSRTQVDRLLNPKSDITLSSLQRAAAMVGRRVMIELVSRDVSRERPCHPEPAHSGGRGLPAASRDLLFALTYVAAAFRPAL